MIRNAEELKSFDSGPCTRIVTSLVEFSNGQETCVDVRKFVNTDRYSGPTRQGIVLHYEDVLELLPILLEAKKRLEEKGSYPASIAV